MLLLTIFLKTFPIFWSAGSVEYANGIAAER